MTIETRMEEKSELLIRIPVLTRYSNFGIRVSVGLWLVACSFLFAGRTCLASNLSAKRMSIERTREGDATVFRDSVVVTDDGTRITASTARMYEGRGLALIQDAVHITNPDAQIWADSVRYRFSDKLAELFGNVRVSQESLDIRAPKLLYLSQERLVRADSGLELENVNRSFRLTGRKGTYDLEGDVGVVDSTPMLTWRRDKDSARVTSRRMSWYEKESRARAQGDVLLKSGATELECDTIEFISGPDSGLALGGPRVRDSVSRASGDTMTFQVRNGGLERVTVLNRATGEYRTEGGDSIVVAGKSIELRVANGAIDQVEVRELSSGQLIRTGRQHSVAEAGTGVGGPNEP
jgi:lipopolysaccharide export system protein LptA